MIRLSLAEVAAATGGTLAGGADAAVVVDGSVVVDSRTAAPGGLFVALPGERADGADFAAAAHDAGSAVLAQRTVEGPHVLVPDATAALGRLARAVLDRLPGTAVAGVTGSSGKTGTKDLLAAALAAQAPTVAAAGSYNNEVGAPLTVLRADEGTRFLVVEMGARGVGHVAALCAIAPPRVGAVLNVGAAHAGEFGSLEAVARAKGELVEALPAAADGGVAVLNADDARVRAMARRTAAHVVLAGTARDAGVRADDVTTDALGRPRFDLRVADELLERWPGAAGARGPVALRLHGEHHVGNALVAVAVALALGAEGEGVRAALCTAEPASRWRMEVTERPDGVTVVNDAYNANPDSVRAALRTLAAMGRPAGGARRRTWAVLGEMLELGDSAAAEHDALGRLAVRLDVSHLVAVGQGARAVHTGAVHEGSWGEEAVFVPDADAAAALLAEQLRPGDVVLVKSSHGAGLRHLGDALAGRDAGGVSPQ